MAAGVRHGCGDAIGRAGRTASRGRQGAGGGCEPRVRRIDGITEAAPECLLANSALPAALPSVISIQSYWRYFYEPVNTQFIPIQRQEQPAHLDAQFCPLCFAAFC